MTAPSHPQRAKAYLMVFLAELRAITAWASEPHLWAVLVIGFALWSLAYTQPYTYRLDFGGDRATHRRLDDAPYLVGFHAPEPEPPAPPAGQQAAEWWDANPQQPTYRWTMPDAEISLPGMGRGTWLVNVQASRPSQQTAPSQWSNGTITTTITLSASPRVYHVLLYTRDDVDLHFSTPPFQAPGDKRALGFVAYCATFAPLSRPMLPALDQLGLLAAIIALGYGTARRVGVARRTTLLTALVVVAGLAVLLAHYRLALTSFTPTLLVIAAGCYVLALVGRWTLDAHPLTHLRTRSPAYFVVGLVVLAFALRLGVLHPHAISSDVGLHSHNLSNVIQGMTYFTEGLPKRSGGGDAPYPPGGYLLLAPFQLLLPSNDDAQRLLIELGTALYDALVVGLLWYVLRRVGAGERAALLGGGLYIVAVPLLGSFSIGEYENILGQELALPLLAFLTVAAPRLRAPRVYALAGVLMLLAVLGHLGATISLVLLLVWLGAIWLVSRVQRHVVVPLALVGAGAAMLAGLFYHSAFVYLLTQSRTTSASGFDLAGWLGGIITLLTGYKYISPVLVWLGGLGAFWLHRQQQARSLRLLLAAWWGTTLVSLVPPLGGSLRWPHFLYPALCLGAGPLLAALWQRGRAGRIATISVIAGLFWGGVAFWVTQLANYLH